MASSSPHAQEHTFAASIDSPGPASSFTTTPTAAPTSTSTTPAPAFAHDIAIPSPILPLYPVPFQQEPSQPPSPNGISAAAILATLSDSRPPTSHAEDILSDDDEPGGVSLAGHVESAGAPEVPFALHHDLDIPGFVAQMSMEQSLHAAAIDALTMDVEQLPTPSFSAGFIPTLEPHLDTFSAHQDLPPITYEEHLSIRDTTAFVDITSFLEYYQLPKGLWPSLDLINPPETIHQEDLNGEKLDFQGIDWTERSSRSNIRAIREEHERRRIEHRVFTGHGLTYPHCLRNTENYFSFRRMNTKHRVTYPHFQLRNLMTALSRNDIIYATKQAIVRTDAMGSPAVPVIDLQKQLVNGQASQVTTLAAHNNVLIAGGIEGDYAIADLSSTDETSVHFGVVKDCFADARSYISNHVHMFDSRSSYAPYAALCSNDHRLRVLDCTTGSMLHSFAYPAAVNCSATSPDGRMRVIVGDFQETLITNAETGQPFETLNAHVDDAFACAWADDGIHVASAAQDSTIAVWDARFWKRPITVMPSELSIPRVLRFSPIGSGPRVLVSAEADDYISIINAQTWDSKQVFDFFGPTAGISMTPDGQSLFVANSEKRFGGIIELQRTGWGADDESLSSRWGNSYDDAHGYTYAGLDDEDADWGGDSDMELDPRVVSSASERDRRGLNLGDFVI